MAFSALQTIQLRASQWSTDPRLVSLIALAKQGLSQTICGDRYGEAVGLKVLHWLAKEAAAGGDPGTGSSSGSGSTGMLIGEREGQLSRSYAKPFSGSSGNGISAGIEDFTTTSYGRELIALLKQVTFSARNRTV
jgi:hypothetical protein